MEAQRVSCTGSLLAGEGAVTETTGKGNPSPSLQTHGRVLSLPAPLGDELLPCLAPAPQQPPPERTWRSDLQRPPVEISILQPLAKYTGEMTGWGKDGRGPHRYREQTRAPARPEESLSLLSWAGILSSNGRGSWPEQRKRETPSLKEYKRLIHQRKSFPGFHQPDK